MPLLDVVCQTLSSMAPLRLAEDWDNVGLLIGDRKQSIKKAMTCLTVTPNVVEEAVADDADLVITHHPLPFKPLGRLTADSIPGSMLLKLIGNGISLYSAHTAFDSASQGINQHWATMLGLTDVETLLPTESDLENEAPLEGTGRLGRLAAPETLASLATRASDLVGAPSPRIVGQQDQSVSKVALACGSGGSFLSAANRRGCDVMLTGEATFHTCLEAESLGIGLILLGHYWSERFAMERMADDLQQEIAELTVWASRSEHDPLTMLLR